MSDTEDVKIRKSLMDKVRVYVKKYPVFYDDVEEFVGVAVRNELIKMRTMEER